MEPAGEGSPVSGGGFRCGAIPVLAVSLHNTTFESPELMQPDRILSESVTAMLCRVLFFILLKTLLAIVPCEVGVGTGLSANTRHDRMSAGPIF